MHKTVRSIAAFFAFSVILIVSPLFSQAQDAPPPPPPPDSPILKMVTSIKTVDANGRVVVDIRNQDVTQMRLYSRPGWGASPLNIKHNGELTGRASIWFQGNWILGEGDTWLNQSNGTTWKIRAQTSSIMVNGTTNADSKAALKETSTAFDSVFAGSLGLWSGCHVVNLGGNRRTAEVRTYHARRSLTGTSDLNPISNSASTAYSCTGE